MKKSCLSTLTRPLGILLLALLATLVLACSTAPAAAPVSTTSTQQFSSIPIVSTPVPEQQPVPGAVAVYITLQEFRITASITAFHAGVPYYFIVTNRGHVVHEFMMMRENSNGTPVSFSEDSSTMFIHIEQVFPGTTLKMNFTFTSSLIGKSEIACLMRGHYAAGMHLPVVVEQA